MGMTYLREAGNKWVRQVVNYVELSIVLYCIHMCMQSTNCIQNTKDPTESSRGLE